jgi:hypothetical protein
MASITRIRLVLVCVLVLACGDEKRDECAGGGAVMCTESTGAIEVSYCRADGLRSECTLAQGCDPLMQTGCDAGLACFAATDWTFCAPARNFPCPPGQMWETGIDGLGCQKHCVHDGRDGPIEDPTDCEDGEICHKFFYLPDGVGTCLVIEAD